MAIPVLLIKELLKIVSYEGGKALAKKGIAVDGLGSINKLSAQSVKKLKAIPLDKIKDLTETELTDIITETMEGSSKLIIKETKSILLETIKDENIVTKKLIPKIPKEVSNPYYNTEQTIRGINRRLETFGNKTYTSLVDGEQRKLPQYEELQNRLEKLKQKYKNVKDIDKYFTINKNGNLQIKRSKNALREFDDMSRDLEEILKSTPTYQDELNKIRKDNNLSVKKAKIKMEEEYQLKELLDESNIVDLIYDLDDNEDLLEIVRGEMKGGKRKGKLTKEDWEKINNEIMKNKEYLFKNRQNEYQLHQSSLLKNVFK